METIY